MAELNWWVGNVRYLLRMASFAVLMVYVLLTSFVPAELLLLANDDDVYVEPITREEAEEHFVEHLQRVKYSLAGVGAPVTEHVPNTRAPKITSKPIEMGVQSKAALAIAVVPDGLIFIGILKAIGARMAYPYVLDLSPQFGVLRLPPRPHM
jgi:hypothetical protein